MYQANHLRETFQNLKCITTISRKAVKMCSVSVWPAPGLLILLTNTKPRSADLLVVTIEKQARKDLFNPLYAVGGSLKIL